MTEPTETPRRRLGIDVIGTVNVVLAAAVMLVAFLALFRIAATSLAGTGHALIDVQLPLVIAASLLVLGVTTAWTAVDLIRRREDGRTGTLAVVGVLLGTVYLYMHVGSILAYGTVFGNDPLVVLGGVVAAVVYAAPILVYLTREGIEAAFEPTPIGAGTGTTPGIASEDLDEVETGQVLDPTIVQGEEIEGGTVPEGAIAETQCTRCDTPIAVAARRRPVLVECPQCGLHGELTGPEAEPASGRRRETTGRGYV